MLQHQIEPAPQHCAAFLGGPLSPVFLRRFRMGDGFCDLGAAQVRDLGDDISARRVGDLKGLGTGHKLTVYIGARFPKGLDPAGGISGR